MTSFFVGDHFFPNAGMCWPSLRHADRDQRHRLKMGEIEVAAARDLS
jgi:hypothetical protein